MNRFGKYLTVFFLAMASSPAFAQSPLQNLQNDIGAIVTTSCLLESDKVAKKDICDKKQIFFAQMKRAKAVAEHNYEVYSSGDPLAPVSLQQEWKFEADTAKLTGQMAKDLDDRAAISDLALKDLPSNSRYRGYTAVYDYLQDHAASELE